MSVDRQVAVLRQGAKAWNEWRERHGMRRLYRADLRGLNLAGANLSNARLLLADLTGADLSGANLKYAKLTAATLRDVNLNGACLEDAKLNDANLMGADLTGADLRRSRFIKTDLRYATLVDCRIYGISAWSLELEGATQANLVITEDPDPTVTVDDVEVGQFVHLLLNNPRIRSVIQTVGEKAVLILGRFTPKRKAVLDALRAELHNLGYVPIIFDFERAADRDFTETVMMLAGMSLFCIADITAPSSIPQELTATVPDYMIPFVPICQKNARPYAMFADLANKYNWVLDLLKYDSVETLVRALPRAIIEPALTMHQELRQRKAASLRTRDASDYL